MKTNKEKAAIILEERKQLFLTTHCQTGTFLADGGLVNGVCKPVSAEEMLNFMSVTVALVIEAMDSKK